MAMETERSGECYVRKGERGAKCLMTMDLIWNDGSALAVETSVVVVSSTPG